MFGSLTVTFSGLGIALPNQDSFHHLPPYEIGLGACSPVARILVAFAFAFGLSLTLFKYVLYCVLHILALLTPAFGLAIRVPIP